MNKFKPSSSKHSPPERSPESRGAWHDAVYLILVAFVAAASPGHAADLVHCYQEDLDLVQLVSKHDCNGLVVSADEAITIQKRRREYLRETFESSGWRPREGLHLRGVGSGFAVSSAGHFLTNHHVVKGCHAISALTPQGLESQAHPVRISPARDLALLQTSAEAPHRDPVLFAAPNESPILRTLAEDETDGSATMVRFLGYPNQGRPPRVPLEQPGQLLALTGQIPNIPIFAFRGDIRPGSSGGPLLNHRGRVIGLVFAQADAPAIREQSDVQTASEMVDVGYALPLWEILLFLEQAGVEYAVADSEEDSAPEANNFMARINCWDDGKTP
jgi:S1-C subfamily serine protease